MARLLKTGTAVINADKLAVLKFNDLTIGLEFGLTATFVGEAIGTWVALSTDRNKARAEFDRLVSEWEFDTATDNLRVSAKEI